MMKVLSKIYWKFYPGINTKVVYLQRYICCFKLTEDIVHKTYGLDVKYLDYDSDSDLQQWCDVINNSYDDCFYDIPKARKFLKKHPIFENGRTALFIKDSIPCATVSYGGFKANPNVGGDYRIGVRNEYQGNGLGTMCVEFAYSRLAEQGYRLGESIITIKRSRSILLHFSLGFEPQFDMRYVTYKDNLKNINFIQKIRLIILLRKYYNQHKLILKNSFR